MPKPRKMSTVAGIVLSDDPGDWRAKAEQHRAGQVSHGVALAPRPRLADLMDILADRMDDGETAEEALAWLGRQ